MLLLQELSVVWPCSSTGIKTPSQRRLSAAWKVWTVGHTVEDAGHLLFPLTFKWSGDNKGLSAIGKGESESLTHGWWGDVSWPVIKKMNHITKASGTRKLPLLSITPLPQLSPWRKRGDCFNIWAYSLHSLIWHTKNVFCPVPPPWGSEKVARCICGETFFMSDCMPCIPPQTV